LLVSVFAKLAVYNTLIYIQKENFFVQIRSLYCTNPYRPKLEYCSQARKPHFENILRKVQRRATKMISEMSWH